MKSKKQQVCRECSRLRDRCKAVSLDEGGEIVWICPRCWREKDYDAFLYEHHKEDGYGHGV